MFQINLKSRQSIYEQVISNMKKMILSGMLKTDEKIPSVRELSRTLTVNPNTVQKAYRELEAQGFIYTVAGRGCFVSSKEERKKDLERIKDTSAELAGNIRELIYLGVSDDSIRTIVEEQLGKISLDGEQFSNGLSADGREENSPQESGRENSPQESGRENSPQESGREDRPRENKREGSGL